MANAQNLTTAALVKLQARVEEMWGQGTETPHRFPWKNYLGSAEALLSNQTANPSPIIDAQGNCRGYEVHWLNYGDGTLDFNGVNSAFDGTCSLTSGDEPVSNSKIYENNVTMSKIVSLSDDVCGSIFKDPGSPGAEQAATLIANRLNMAMHTIRSAVNTKAINFFNSNFSAVNNDDSLPSGLTFASGSGFTVDESVIPMNDPTSLTEMMYLAENNAMEDYFLLSGRKHFASAITNSDFLRLNDDQRSQVQWDAYQIFLDPKSLDSTLSGANTFLVSRGSYVFWNHLYEGLTATPREIAVNDGMGFEYSIQDPVLSYNQNGVLVPLTYTVMYQRKCDGVNVTELRRTEQHIWEVKLNGGLYTAPASEDGHTGILKVKSA